ncbi:NAD(P)/FAD-dependent oxidoreductase [Cumulibacter soli]|uniref:NAD(P)/FAD-dependent oxidoreductase n=1 Tax=Cumulibacter soli TaxID=2546344 RepID=UPI0010680D78|nr:FAD-dependent oxidoreductase [Cumulibacter soli]
MPATNRPSVAVIGSGVSGLSAAYLLSRTHRVSVLESDSRVGGHAHTHQVSGSRGRPLSIDTGFVVMNQVTYPNLTRLFRELGVRTRPAEMSMSITCGQCGLSYAGGSGIGGILAQPGRLRDARFRRLLSQVPRFHRDARRLLASARPEDRELTWGEFLTRRRYGAYFVQHFAIPLVACVWSCGHDDAFAYPARHLFQFLEHHGMLQITGSPTWRTVVGGSHSYVSRIVAQLSDVRVDCPVTAVQRHDDGVDVRTPVGVERFDRVVVATHAEQAAELLADATPQEKDDLTAIGYSSNETWLHRDESVLPETPRARASWNYRLSSCHGGSEGVTVSYWMNRLQGLDDDVQHIVTLGADGRVDPDQVSARMTYAHPIFTAEAVESARRLRAAGGDRLAFAGAHLGWGFHEDGCRSGAAAAAKFGVAW